MMGSSSRISTGAAYDLSELPKGFRFHPTEEELVKDYLEMKLQGNDFVVSQVIREIDICNHEPWELPAYSLIKSDDEEWFFFSRPKHNNRKQINRATAQGFWKVTSQNRDIKTRDNRAVIGKKRIMTFHRGRVRKAQKTNWIIHEYYIPHTHPNRDFVLCHLKKKSDESQLESARDMDLQEEYTHRQNNLDDFEMAWIHFLANETDEDGTDFVDPPFVDHDQDLFKEATHATPLSDFTLPQSLKRVYLENGGFSSDTDTEAVHAAKRISLQMLNEQPVGPSHSRQDKDILLRHQLQAASISNVAPKPQTYRLQSVTQEHPKAPVKPKPLPPPIDPKPHASSVSADILRINCLQLATDDYYKNERTRRRSYSQGAPTALGKLREQQSMPQEPNLQKSTVPEPKMQQIKAKEVERQAAVSVPPKMTSATKSSIDKNAAPSNNAEKGMKQTQNATTTSNRKGSFISWQTSPLTSPPSVYIFNTVLGTILFVVFARELVLYGHWG